MKLYFAYGANLNLEGMRFRCPNAKPVSAFLLQDWQLAFSEFATIQPQLGASVPGALWEITDDCENSLDQYEGFPSHYRKEYHKQDGLEFMFYVMNKNTPVEPSDCYYNIILEGYRDWKLPISELDRARKSTLLE